MLSLTSTSSTGHATRHTCLPLPREHERTNINMAAVSATLSVPRVSPCSSSRVARQPGRASSLRRAGPGSNNVTIRASRVAGGVACRALGAAEEEQGRRRAPAAVGAAAAAILAASVASPAFRYEASAREVTFPRCRVPIMQSKSAPFTASLRLTAPAPRSTPPVQRGRDDRGGVQRVGYGIQGHRGARRAQGPAGGRGHGRGPFSPRQHNVFRSRRLAR